MSTRALHVQRCTSGYRFGNLHRTSTPEVFINSIFPKCNHPDVQTYSHLPVSTWFCQYLDQNGCSSVDYDAATSEQGILGTIGGEPATSGCIMPLKGNFAPGGCAGKSLSHPVSSSKHYSLPSHSKCIHVHIFPLNLPPLGL